MKIQDSNPANLSGLRKVDSAPGGTSRGPAAAPGAGDRVQISSLSSQLNAINLNPAQHASRLAGLSKAVSAGTYHVDAERLSSAIIQEHMLSAA
jgi:anti-sigma28 factor (negative regulator of flagellin synthesis)